MQTGMQLFHRGEWNFKTAKYLLITRSFPHSPQVFPQEFSTGRKACGCSQMVHIIRRRGFIRTAYFFEDGVFYYGRIFVQKFGLDKGVRREECGVKESPAAIVFIKANNLLHCPVASADLRQYTFLFCPEGTPKRHTPNSWLLTPHSFSFWKKVKKGVDFVWQTRYNVCLYGKLEEGGAIHAQH